MLFIKYIPSGSWVLLFLNNTSLLIIVLSKTVLLLLIGDALSVIFLFKILILLLDTSSLFREQDWRQSKELSTHLYLHFSYLWLLPSQLIKHLVIFLVQSNKHSFWDLVRLLKPKKSHIL